MKKYKYFFDIDKLNLNNIQKVKKWKNIIYGTLKNNNIFTYCIKSRQLH